MSFCCEMDKTLTKPSVVEIDVEPSNGRKRKSSFGDPRMNRHTGFNEEPRTGRWTQEETAYCDMLMTKFAQGQFPIPEGTKLNDFLGRMLQSKQSRLTKKMKNAKLSTKTFSKTTGHLASSSINSDARDFARLEEAFVNSMGNPQGSASLQFHIQKQWRQQFRQLCDTTGQPLDAQAWLQSVDEYDCRAQEAKEVARMAKRKIMMNEAYITDSTNRENGVFIEEEPEEKQQTVEEEILSLLVEERKKTSASASLLCPRSSSQVMTMNARSSALHSSPFLATATAYLERYNIPFEHIDIWVPSQHQQDSTSSYRLCYAGSATTTKAMQSDGVKSRTMSPEEQFNFSAFGDYSQKFSFDVGSGLPGRVYQSGIATWQRHVENSPSSFERRGGARQWGIQTALGIPIVSPTAGRIVVALYSCYDRAQDLSLVARFSAAFTKVSSLKLLFIRYMRIATFPFSYAAWIDCCCYYFYS